VVSLEIEEEKFDGGRWREQGEETTTIDQADLLPELEETTLP